MIALAVSSAWPGYYSSSPFLNLLRAKHPEFEVFGVLPHELENPDIRERINACEALVVDDVLASSVSFYKGLKFMIGGDPHAHTQDQVRRLESEYACVDYVLTGAVTARRLEKIYKYPPAALWEKHVYFPHMVPDERPESKFWDERTAKVLLSGTLTGEVYPFRYACWVAARTQEGSSLIDVLDRTAAQHEEYFKILGSYRAAVTCSSIFEYTVAKYFEIPWMGAVLMAPKPPGDEAELLGFRNYGNALWAETPGQIFGWARAIQAGSEEMLHISMAGRQLMQTRHTVKARLDYIVRLVKRIKAGAFAPRDAFDIFQEI